MWEVNRWGWLWGYTCAQIELMASDKPFTDYKSGRRNRRGGKSGKGGKVKPEPRLSREKMEKWERRMADTGGRLGPVTIDLSGYKLAGGKMKNM